MNNYNSSNRSFIIKIITVGFAVAYLGYLMGGGMLGKRITEELLRDGDRVCNTIKRKGLICESGRSNGSNEMRRGLK
jgi:hypothetical protein